MGLMPISAPACRHGGEEECQHYGDRAHPPVNMENQSQEQRGQNAGEEDAENEPGHGDIDVIQRTFRGIATAAEAAEDAGERPTQGPPLERQRQQPADHQHRGPRPERPGTDVAEAAHGLQRRRCCARIPAPRPCRRAGPSAGRVWPPTRWRLALRS